MQKQIYDANYKNKCKHVEEPMHAPVGGMMNLNNFN